jgi:hypothetical protein
MGIGRRLFMTMFGSTMASAASSSMAAARVHGDLYVNWRLGAAFTRPTGWFFNDMRDMGEVAQGQLFELDADDVERLWADADALPVLSISQEPIARNIHQFVCGVNVHLEQTEPEDTNVMVNVSEELKVLPQLLRDFRLTQSPVSRTISGCAGGEYWAEFLFEHAQMSHAVVTRMRSLMVLQDRWRYTFRMYDAPTLGELRTFDYDAFVESIRLV